MAIAGPKTKSGNWEFLVHAGNSNVGVVLIHEIFGLDEYADSVAAQLAKSGFWAAAIDMYQGKCASNLEEGLKLRQSITEIQILDGINSGAQLLREKMGANVKIGTMGFCMGGGFALIGACALNLDFCVDYYGLIENPDKAMGLKGPVVLMLGSEDERVTPWAFKQFLPAAMKYKKRVDVHLYPNAKHAFHRPTWEGHNPEAAKDAWAKTLAFLEQFKT